MLGDSLAFGWGVPVEKTSSKQLEQMLINAGHDVEVINTGVGNYNTEMEVAYFLERGPSSSRTTWCSTTSLTTPSPRRATAPISLAPFAGVRVFRLARGHGAAHGEHRGEEGLEDLLRLAL